MISYKDDLKACEIEVAKCGEGYSFKVTGNEHKGRYLSAPSSKNSIKFASSAKALTITLSSGDATIADGGYTFKFNNSNGQKRFRFYTSGQENVTLYKLVTE